MVSFIQGHLGTAGIKRHQLGVKKKKTEKKNLQQALDSRCDVWSWNAIRRLIWQEFKKRRKLWRVYSICASDWAILSLLSQVNHLEDEWKGNLTKKSEAEVSPAKLIWSRPLRTLPRMYADSTLWWAECAFSLLKKENTGQIRKKLVCSPHRWSIKALCRH